ncbi:MAG: VCBS repeat-containing protein [Bacteroidales bacterium]|nr:VCBS repeat-containing protein [Bacteroidales bacterium]
MIWGQNSQTITSGEIHDGLNGIEPINGGDSYGLYRDRNWLSADLNNDGLSDIYNYWQCQVGTEIKTRIQTFYSKPQQDGTVKFTYKGSYTTDPNAGPTNHITAYGSLVSVKNLNGDNKPEIVMPYFINNSMNFIVVNEFNPSGFRFTQNLIANNDEMPAFAIDDFNNDGIDDLLFIEKKAIGSSYCGKINYSTNEWNDNGWTLFNVSVLDNKNRNIFL